MDNSKSNKGLLVFLFILILIVAGVLMVLIMNRNVKSETTKSESKENTKSQIISVTTSDLMEYFDQKDGDNSISVNNHKYTFKEYGEEKLDEFEVSNVDVIIDDVLKVEKIKWASLGTDPWHEIYLTNDYYVVLNGSNDTSDFTVSVYDKHGEILKQYSNIKLCENKLENNYIIINFVKGTNGDDNYSYNKMKIDVTDKEYEVDIEKNDEEIPQTCQ